MLDLLATTGDSGNQYLYSL